MKEKVKNLVIRLVRNQLVKGSAILFLGSVAGNFGNYLYHLLMGRMLGPSDYGALEAVISLLYFLGIPLAGINMVIVKKISSFRGKNQEEKASSFYHFIIKKIFAFGFLGTILFFFALPLIKDFLHLDSVLPILPIIGYSFLGIFLGTNLSVLNAFLKFFQISLVSISSVIGKLISAALLVGLGLSVLGASSAFLIGAILALLLSEYYLRKILKKKRESKSQFRLKSIIRETVPFFVSTLSFTSLYTSDILLARHFLPASQAGFYAALSLLGKIIFFASGPIVQVLFPLVSERHASGMNYKRPFFLGLGMVFLICLGVSVVYLFLPGLMVEFLFGPEYKEAAKYLRLFALFISFYSLANLTCNFLLSISKNRAVILPFLAALVQIVLIIFFHQDIVQIVFYSSLVCGLLFASLMVYFLQGGKAYELKKKDS